LNRVKSGEAATGPLSSSRAIVLKKAIKRNTGASAMWNLERALATGLLICLIPLLNACNSTGGVLSSFGNNPVEIELPASVDPYPDSEVLHVAKIQFADGNYGHAARYYERAVEVAPNNAEAWLGLAASYDRGA
jgi:tetratricopeptide (TPR) repeat protein